MDVTNDREYAKYKLQVLFKDASASDSENGRRIGDTLFALETESGLPLELSFDLALNGHSRETKAWAIHQYQILRTRHKIKSGISRQNLERAQLNNRKEFHRFIG